MTTFLAWLLPFALGLSANLLNFAANRDWHKVTKLHEKKPDAATRLDGRVDAVRDAVARVLDKAGKLQPDGRRSPHRGGELS